MTTPNEPPTVDANAVLAELQRRFPLELEIAMLTVRIRELEAPPDPPDT